MDLPSLRDILLRFPASAQAGLLPATAGLLLLAWAGGVLLAGCANPVPPSGGPRDQAPPRIAESRPAAEATNVSGRSVQILFSEYVDRESFREALSVTPGPEGRLRFDWSGRSVEVTFPEPLRDSTTYLLVIDKALSDVRGVSLDQPITLAFSTGAQIDRGRLSGRVIGNARGDGREGFDVYAYAAAVADSAALPEAPLYRTQTGPDGAFEFAYLREEERYYVVALRDRNRNSQLDPLEPFAAPPRPALAARGEGSIPAGDAPPGNAPGGNAQPDSARAGALPPRVAAGDTSRVGQAGRSQAPWVAAFRDSVPPRLTRALPLSRQRVALRFSEPVRFQARRAERVALTDTSAGQSVAVRSLYRRPGQAQRITLRTAPMRADAAHRARLTPLRAAAGEAGNTTEAGNATAPVVADTSGNAPERPAEAVFTATERADTLGLRFLGFERAGPPLPTSAEGNAAQGNALALTPGQAPAVQFNQPPFENGSASNAATVDSAAARRLVAARDTATGAALPFRLQTRDGTTYRLVFDPPLAPGQVARLRVDGRRLRPAADTAFTRLAQRLPQEALGSVAGAVQLAPGAATSADTAASADSATGTPVADTSVADTAAVADTAGASSPILVELYPAENGDGTPLRTTRVAGSAGGFRFEGLPEAAYRFRAFLDRDADGEWDAGRLAPYRRAEPLAWSRQPVEARARWETATEDTLQIFDSPPSTNEP